jgi:hypothetical protein
MRSHSSNPLAVCLSQASSNLSTFQVLGELIRSASWRRRVGQLAAIWQAWGTPISSFDANALQDAIQCIAADGPSAVHTIEQLHKVGESLRKALQILQDIGPPTEEEIVSTGWDVPKLLSFSRNIGSIYDLEVSQLVAHVAMEVADSLMPPELIDIDICCPRDVEEQKRELEAVWQELKCSIYEGPVNEEDVPCRVWVQDPVKTIHLFHDIELMISAADAEVSVSDILEEHDLDQFERFFEPDKDGKDEYTVAPETTELHRLVKLTRKRLMDMRRESTRKLRDGSLENLNHMWKPVRDLLKWVQNSELSTDVLDMLHSKTKGATSFVDDLIGGLRGDEKGQCVWEEDMIQSFRTQLCGLSKEIKAIAGFKDLDWMLRKICRMLNP